MKVTINLTRQEAIEALLQFYKHTGASEIVISDDTPDEGWISNVGRNRVGHPETLNYDTKVEVKFRNGTVEVGNAKYWNYQWKETDDCPRDIVAYRILKD
jgi:hypothetical protein